MSKAILVIDKPNDCRNCPLFSFQLMRCNYTGNNKLDIFGCPLKEMPKKMPVETRWFDEEFTKGWNACLEEINGGEQHEQ